MGQSVPNNDHFRELGLIKEKTTCWVDVFESFISVFNATVAEESSTSFGFDLTSTEAAEELDLLSDLELGSESVDNTAPPQLKFENLLIKWVDPLTPPKLKNGCVKYCRAGPLKTCCGWKLQKKWMYRRATLVVNFKKPGNVNAIKKDIEKCIKAGAAVAAIAAIKSGGTAALSSAQATITACLSAKFTSNLASVKINSSSGWGDWE